MATNKKTKGYTKTKFDIYKLFMATKNQPKKNLTIEYVKENGIWPKDLSHEKTN